MNQLTIATYNIHKGFSHFNRRVVLHGLRERLRALNADIVFLQEVQGEHRHHAANHREYPEEAQHEFIAESVWPHHAYGKNAVYEAGHHGNALLSRFPIIDTQNRDVSAHRFESRGLLHSVIALPNGESLHCLCTHFGLFARGRREQTQALIAHVRNQVPQHAPLIVAGDFNDWRDQMSTTLERELGLQDAFRLHKGAPARSFPARLPLLRLDRIYVRGFSVLESQVHSDDDWHRLSDHAALSTRLTRHSSIVHA